MYMPARKTETMNIEETEVGQQLWNKPLSATKEHVTYVGNKPWCGRPSCTAPHPSSHPATSSPIHPTLHQLCNPTDYERWWDNKKMKHIMRDWHKPYFMWNPDSKSHVYICTQLRWWLSNRRSIFLHSTWMSVIIKDCWITHETLSLSHTHLIFFKHRKYLLPIWLSALPQ